VGRLRLAQPLRRGAVTSRFSAWRAGSHWFTEGFDTADPKDAKALLGKLGR
jgi:hypothetical protein